MSANPAQPCATTLGPGEKTVAKMVAATVALAGIGGAVAIVATTLGDADVFETAASDPDSRKRARSAARGQVTSLTSSLTFGMANLANDYVCQINRLTSSVFMALLFGNIFGFVLDASFASDEGLRAFKGGTDDGKERDLGKALQVGFKLMYSRNFVRYVLTLLTDVFVSSILLDELVRIIQAAQGRADAPRVARILLCGPLATALPTILTSVISVVTFIVYTNDTRFSWAFRTNKFPETLDEWALRSEVADSTVPEVQELRSKVLEGGVVDKGVVPQVDIDFFGKTWARSTSRPRGRKLGGAVAEGVREAHEKQSTLSELGADDFLDALLMRVNDVRVHDYVQIEKENVYRTCAGRSFSVIGFMDNPSDAEEARLAFLANMHAGKVGKVSVQEGDRVALQNLALALEGMQPSYQTTNFLLTSSVAAALYLFKDIEGTPRSLKLALVTGFLCVASGLASVNGLERPPALSDSATGVYVGFACYVIAALAASAIVMSSAPTDGSRTFSSRKKMAMAVLFATALSLPPFTAMVAGNTSSVSVGASALVVCFAAFYAYVLADRIRGARSRRPIPTPAAPSAPSASGAAAGAAQPARSLPPDPSVSPPTAPTSAPTLALGSDPPAATHRTTRLPRRPTRQSPEASR